MSSSGIAVVSMLHGYSRWCRTIGAFSSTAGTLLVRCASMLSVCQWSKLSCCCDDNKSVLWIYESLCMLPPWRTGGDHRDAPVLRGWRLPSRTWNQWTSPWMKQLTWLRIVHSGDWCLRLALCLWSYGTMALYKCIIIIIIINISGACQQWMNEWMVQKDIATLQPVVTSSRREMISLTSLQSASRDVYNSMNSLRLK